jgi:proteasome lid subunit RPN8/RPN11
MPKIVHTVCDSIIVHAREEAPHECCGLLAGKEETGIISKTYPIANLPSDDPRIVDLDVPADRSLRYMMDPEAQFDAVREMRNNGLLLMGIYHSHTHSVAYPSETDVRLAFYPELTYFIVSLVKGKPDLRAFRIVEEEIVEERIERVPTE